MGSRPSGPEEKAVIPTQGARGSRARGWGRGCSEEALRKFLTFFGLCLWALRWRSPSDSAGAPSLPFAFQRKILAESREFGGGVLISKVVESFRAGVGVGGPRGRLVSLLIPHCISLPHLSPQPQAQIFSDVHVMLPSCALWVPGDLAARTPGSCQLCKTSSRPLRPWQCLLRTTSPCREECSLVWPLPIPGWVKGTRGEN